MNERPTDNGGRQAAEEVHSPAEAGDLREWESTGNGVEVSRRYGIHPMTLYRWKKRLEQGAAEFLKGSRSKPNPRVKELERENQNTERHGDFAVSGPDAVKKKDELGLTGRRAGQAYSQEQRAKDSRHSGQAQDKRDFHCDRATRIVSSPVYLLHLEKY